MKKPVIVKPLELGDVVKLRSGSPKMVLYTVTDNGHYWCRWWDSKQSRLREEAFQKTDLVKVRQIIK